jgi:HTH-type transcriptional regulator, competence development regulator
MIPDPPTKLRCDCLTSLASLGILSGMSQSHDKLGTYLASARNRKGLSLRAVEAATGISNAYLSQLETGKIREPSPSNLHKLAGLYGVSYPLLLELAGYPVPGGRSPEAAGSALAARIGPTTREEEDALVDYLAFLRSKRKPGGRP